MTEKNGSKTKSKRLNTGKHFKSVMNRTTPILILSLFSLILLLGCVDVNNAMGNQTPEPKIERIEVPVHSYEAEKIVHYSCSEENNDYCSAGLEAYMAYSQNYLRCSFITLEDNSTAEMLVKLREAGVTVEILLDRASTFDRGLPREETQYNFLIKNLVDVQTIDVYENYCVSDRGIVFGTFFPSQNKLPIKSTFMVIYSKELMQLYLADFLEKFERD